MYITKGGMHLFFEKTEIEMFSLSLSLSLQPTSPSATLLKKERKAKKL